MYEYLKGNTVYYGNKECGTPVRTVKTVSESEARYWERLEREIRRQERNA